MATSAKKVPTPPVRKKAEDWSSSDRSSKRGAAHLHDLRIRAEIGIELDRVAFVSIVTTLEDVLDVAQDVTQDFGIVAEELPDVLRKMDEKRANAEDELSEAERKHEEEIAAVKEAQTNALKDHEIDMAEMGKTVDELRKRAELAEHNLEQGVRNGHVLDQDAAKQIAAAKQAQAEAESRCIDLEQALEHARKQNPMRARVRRVK